MADNMPELGDEAEALLADWPVAHRAELNWEDFATETVARAWSDNNDLDLALLEAPTLQAEPGEPTSGAQAVEPEADFSLKDLAIASLASNKAAESHQDLTQQALSTSRQDRASNPSFHDIPRTSEIRAAKAELRLAASDGATQPQPAPQQPAAGGGQAPHATTSPRRGGVVLAAVLGLAAAAACVMLWQGGPGDAAVAEAPAQPKPSPETQAIAEAPVTAPAPSPTLSVEPLLAQAPSAAVPRGIGGSPSQAGSGQRLAVAAKAAPEPAATAAPAPTEEPDDPRLVPAAKPESLPLEPSTGAALAAVGRVMGGAKACVAGHPSASTATLTFASSGKVQSVSVGPPAAGTAAEGCIRNALSGARVAPFAKPSFTIRVPIRP